MTLRTRATDRAESKLPRLIVRYIAVVVSATALVTAYSAWRNATDLKESLITACETNRTPLQVFFSNQLRQSERVTIREYQAAFPAFDPDEIKRSILNSRRNLRGLLETYDPSRCVEQYD